MDPFCTQEGGGRNGKVRRRIFWKDNDLWVRKHFNKPSVTRKKSLSVIWKAEG